MSNPAAELLEIDNIDISAATPADSTPPTIAAVTGPAGTFVVGQTVTVTLDASEDLVANGASVGGATLTLDIGGASRTAAYSAVSGGSAQFTYTVQAGDADSDGISVTSVNIPANALEDGAGNDLNTAGAPFALATTLVDAVPPSAPGVPDLASGSDRGASDTDNITNVTTPTFTGTAEAGTSVTLFRDANSNGVLDGGESLGAETATGGNWSVTSSALTAGVYNIRAIATDAAGNASPASGVLSVTLDTTDPAVAFTAAAGPFTGPFFVDATVSSDAASSFVEGDVSITGGSITPASFTDNGGGSFTFEVTPSAPGSVTIETAAGAVEDAAGNQSAAASISRTVNAPTVTLNVSDASPGEADGSVSLTAALSSAFPASTTVNLAYSGTASGGGADYTEVTPITIEANALTGTATLNLTNDALDETSETIVIDIASVSGGGGALEDGAQQVTVTIADDDATPAISIADFTDDENAGNASFDVTLGAPSGQTVQVSYATSTGTAMAGTDYTTTTGTLTFLPGDTLETITVPVTGDTTVELDETLTVTLSSPTNATISDSEATGTITNDDTATLSIADVSQAEGDAGTSTFDFTVTLSAASDADVSFTATTADGTAEAGTDYTVLSAAPFTIAAGDTSATVQVTVAGDTGFEPGETFTVTLAGLAAAGRDVTFADDEATGTITNDDVAPLVTLAASLTTIAETAGTSMLTASLSAVSSQAITVDLAYSNANITGPASIVVPAGNLSADVTVTAVDNALDEPDRTTTVEIDSVTNGIEDGTQQVTLTLTDDDGAPGLSIADVTLAEGDVGSSVMTFTVGLGAASANTVTVDYATADDSAQAGTDYTAATGTLTFTPGDTEETFDVTIAGDAVVELDEAFIVTLSAASNATISDSEATGTITNDDVATLSIADVTQAERNTGASTFDFTVTLSAASDADVSFTATTTDGTAEAGSDYTALSAAPFTLAAGDTTATVQVTVTGDSGFEPAESFTVTLAGLAAAGRDVTFADDEATGAITNDDAAPNLTLADVSVAESAGVAVVTATLDSPAGAPVSFTWFTTNGSAAAPDDYTGVASASATIPAGASSVDLQVAVIDDALEELAESFTVTLSGLSGAVTADTEALVTIEASDVAAPEAVLSAEAGPVSGPFDLMVSFTEAVTGLERGDFAATNAVLSDLSGSQADYTLTVTPSGDGLVTITLAAGAVEDTIGTASLAPEPFSLTADLTAPAVTLTTAETGVVSGPFQITISFSEAVTGFERDDLAVDNGSASDLATTDDTVFTATVTPTLDGLVTVSLAAGAALDAAGNASTAAEPLTVETDATAPEVTIALPGETTPGVFTASFTFSEPVAGLELDDIAVTNGAASGLTTRDDTVFLAEITPSAPGAVIVSLAAGAAADAAGNASLEASAAIEAVAEADAVVLVLDSTVDDPESVGATAPVTNPGSDPLSFTAAADVPWVNVSPASGVVPSLGEFDLVVTLNAEAEALAAGDYVGTVTVIVGEGASRGDAMSSASAGMVLVEVPISLEVQARFGGVTLVATTPSGASGEASFSYASDIDAFDALTLTTSGGRASASVAELLQGGYQISQTLPAGWRVESISCAGDLDDGSSFDVEAGVAAIDLDANESLVCTFENVRDEDAVRLATQRAIRGFMVRRADRIVEAAPDLSRRFFEREMTQRGAFAGDIDGAGRRQLSLSGSLSGMRNAEAADTPSIAGVTNYERPVLDGWDVWFAAELSGLTDNRAGERAESSFGIAQLGVDYQLSDTLILGVLAQYDWMEETAQEVFEEAGALRGARVKGDGWMAGPYAVWRIGDTLIFDVLAMSGRSDNSVDLLGLYQDDFTTDRYMLRANLTGEFVSPSGAWRLRPQAGITHFEETQDGYVDSLGITIPEQTLALGRFRAGPELAWRRAGADGGFLELTTALNAVWDYQTAELFNEAGLLVGGEDDLRADARFGLSTLTPWGAFIRLETGLDGIGIGDFEARTGRFEIRIPFGAPGTGGGGASRVGSAALGDTCSSSMAPTGFDYAAVLDQRCVQPS